MLDRVKGLVSLSSIVLAGTVSASAQTTADSPTRLPPSLAQLERLAVGKRHSLDRNVMFVPKGYRVPASGKVPLYIHFQGGVRIAEENFARMDRPGVLIASTLTGRSSAFSKPYSDAATFRSLLAAGAAILSDQFEAPVRFAPITITSFSAGYGAVREILAVPEFYSRIDNLVMADSIYASVVAPGVRAPRAGQMVDFARFAQAAAGGEKTFVITHSAYQTDYASTTECANLLLASVAASRRQVEGQFTTRGVPIAAEAHVGGFHLYAFAEADKRIHADCLYMIPDLVRRHVCLDPGPVRALFADLRGAAGVRSRARFPKDLGWRHIPALLDHLDKALALRRFPINPISSQSQARCTEGMLALWLIEGIRRHQPPRFASLNPLCVRGQAEGDWEGAADRNLEQVAKHYRRWWADVACRSEARGRATAPLAGTGLHWH